MKFPSRGAIVVAFEKPGEPQVVALPDASLVKPGQTQVVDLPSASLVGDIKQKFVAWCEQQGLTVMRSQAAGGVVLTIGKPNDTCSAAGS